MMEAPLLGSMTALWLGVLTSISPCPLAANIAAISFLGKELRSTKQALMAGLFYTAGRMLTYFVLAFLVVTSLIAVPALAQFLQRHMNQILGPILILVGVFLLGWVSWSSSRLGLVGEAISKFKIRGRWSALLLGILFALSFCPVSAALFFGSLIPLSVSHGSSWLLPGLYGLGTSLPVICFAFVLALGAHKLGRTFNLVSQFDKWFRRATGIVFIAVGAYCCLRYLFEVPFLMG